jgi:xanthine/CO dehydrogenase XdhC/CoxF family maturation factor
MSVAGSAYRGPGARMVVLANDTTVGAISGGCLEKDVVAHAAKVRAGGTALAVSYDLTGDDDAPWSLNMGCNAKLDVLLEPCPAGVPEYLAAALAGLAARAAVVVSALFKTSSVVGRPSSAGGGGEGGAGAGTARSWRARTHR